MKAVDSITEPAEGFRLGLCLELNQLVEIALLKFQGFSNFRVFVKRVFGLQVLYPSLLLHHSYVSEHFDVMVEAS